MRSILWRTAAVIGALIVWMGAADGLRAQNVTKANNTTNLVDGASWVGGSAPTSLNVALWNSTVTAANTPDLGGNLSIAGIKITNPGGAIGITSGTVNSGAVTASSAADTFTYTSTDVVNGNIVTFGGTTMPGGIVNGRLYFIVNTNTTAKTYQVSDTANGSAINFTSSGSAVTNTARYALTIGSSGIDLGSATQSLASLSAPVSLSDNQTWTAATNRFIDINNNANATGISLLNNGYTLTVDTGGGRVDLGNMYGGGGITKNGAGTLNLFGTASSFTGNFEINAGLVSVSNDSNALGSGGSTLTMAGGTVSPRSNFNSNYGRNTVVSGNAGFYNNNSSQNGAMAYTFGTLSIGAFTYSVTANGSGTGSLTYGATTLTGSPTFDVGSRDINSLVLGAVGETGGARGLTKTGVGTLRLTGASTYTGTTTISGGLLELTGAGSLPTAGAVVNDATLNVSGITASGLTIGSLAGSGTVALGGKALTLGDGTNTTFGGGITGSGGALTKQGEGSFTLTGVNSYSGATSVNAGTLVVNGSLANDSLTVASGATLMGSGTIAGTTTISGMHNPGNSPGVQTFSNLTYSGSTASVTWELWGNTISNSPVAYDQINVTGNLSFTDLTTVYLSFTGTGSSVNWEDPFWDQERSWVLYDVTGTTSGFGNLSLAVQNWQDGSVLPKSFATVRPNSSFALQQIGSDVVVAYTIIVPEPGTLALAGIGLVIAGRSLWKRRRPHPLTHTT